VKSEENSMIQTTMALNVEVEKIGDIGWTADLLEILYDSANTFLYSLIFPFFATHKAINCIFHHIPIKYLSLTLIGTIGDVVSMVDLLSCGSAAIRG
jgi:hypothetical protein